MIVTVILCDEKLFVTRKQTQFIICEWACDFYFGVYIGRLNVSTRDDVPFYYFAENLEARFFCLVR